MTLVRHDPLVDEVVQETIAAWPDLADGTRTARPKAWGALAAHGVTALRDRLGRAPSDRERRALWAALWDAATARGR
jgi:hypothetical protein